jgi:dolichyl-diphosphooligosaccharide--protein glycosyltransferase
MRKRAQLRSKPVQYEPKHITEKKPFTYEEKPRVSKKNLWIGISLIAIFFIVLLYNSYFNLSSGAPIDEDGTDFSKYLLSGPDPYYNMRLVEVTYETGEYPFYAEKDYLLNYPLGARGGRAPLLNMMALGFSRFLAPFMDEVDAIGYSMQFVPALCGALIIFPVYFIGKALFNKKAGLIAAFFMAIIPIHIGSGHGSAYSLFDHDSFNLLLFFLTFMFLILSIKEKDKLKSMLFAVLGAVPLAGLSMVWVEAQFIYVILGVYAIVQIIINIFSSKYDLQPIRSTAIIVVLGWLISLPVLYTYRGLRLDNTLFMCAVVVLAGFFYYLFNRKKTPWVLTLPAIFIAGAGGIVFLYLVRTFGTGIEFFAPLQKLAEVIFGTGIYGQKVSMTIAEANTYQISHTVMSFGPALYWLGWGGFIFLLWYYYKDKLRSDYLFILVLFIINLWLAGTAGRFLNDMVPLIAILAGWIVWFIVAKIDYKQMLRNIRSAGGGIHGIRRGVKVLHIFGILFLAVIVILPNAFVAFDAAVPNSNRLKDDGENWTSLKGYMFGDDNYQGAYGLVLSKERYWSDAFNWLSQQDTEIESPYDRPAFISWWDYGFYEAALGGHPTVADNFQDGIPPASNFHTATSEKDAITVWCVRLLEGYVSRHNGKLSDEIEQVLDKHLGNNSETVIGWVLNPRSCDSFEAYVDEPNNEYIADEIPENILQIGTQWPANALYHDVVNMFNNVTYGLDEEQVTRLYHDLQEATGYSIRYYGVEGYDEQIFNIFAFLSDKSLVMVGSPEDQFTKILFTGKTYTGQNQVEQTYENEPLQTYFELDDEVKRRTVVETTPTVYKDDYFDTMFYRTYIGPVDESTGEKKKYQWQVPCINMKHFYAEFISDLSKFQYSSGKAAVVIAKYYEGAFVNGTVSYKNNPINATVVVQKNITYYEDVEAPIEHDKFNFIGAGNITTDQFSVLAGAGAHLQIRRNLGQSVFVLKNITFNGLEDTDLAPITDDDAMRLSDNYERFLNITIESANIQGTVFNDIDDNGAYNASVDEPLEDINVNLQEILNIKEDNTFDTGFTSAATTDENGQYNFTDLMPGLYRVLTYNDDGYTLDLKDMPLYEGNRTYNVINPSEGDLEGILYYDKDLDGKYESGEEISDAVVELLFNRKSINNDTTQSDGSYSFTSLKSGQYNEYTLNVETTEYQAQITTTVEANATKTQNISLQLIPVTVSGQALYNGDGADGVEIEFSPNGSVDKNTATANGVATDAAGSYSVSLQPGSYNISITKYAGNTDTLIYTLEGETLVLTKGQGTASKNFYVEKKSVTVSGITSSDGDVVGNVSLRFYPDNTVENNTALLMDTTSDVEDGSYTIELTPGSYNVSGERGIDPEEEVNITYTGFKKLTVTEDNISDGIVFNFDTLARDEEE